MGRRVALLAVAGDGHVPVPVGPRAPAGDTAAPGDERGDERIGGFDDVSHLTDLVRT
jgi:hypothetical protein